MKLGSILVQNAKIREINKKQQIVKYILEQIENIDVAQMKMNPDFIMFICEIIENQVPARDKKNPSPNDLDKMEIFVSVMKEISVSDEQVLEAQSIVEFLLINKMIKKTPWKTIIYHCVKKFLVGQVTLK